MNDFVENFIRILNRTYEKHILIPIDVFWYPSDKNRTSSSSSVSIREQKTAGLDCIGGRRKLKNGKVSFPPIQFFQDTFIIIISPLQSTAGHTPLQFLAISLDLRLLASSSCQPSCANRHSTTGPEGVLRYVYLDAESTLELVNKTP
jgi:hypothetical protein